MKNKFKLKKILEKVSMAIRPPKIMLPSEWVEENIVLTDGVLQGQKVRLHKFQKGMIDSIKEGKRKIVFRCSAQLGKTLILNGIIFDRMANNPTNIGVCQANVRELTSWLNSKIKPSIEACPALKEVVTDKNDRNAVNNTSTIQMKNGSFLYFMSLNSPSHLRGKTIPLILLDEVDGVVNETEEGDPIQLAEQRASTFQDEARVVIASTPTTRDGAINQQWELSDKRKFFVDCPYCDHNHTIEWESVHFEWHNNVGGKSLPNPDTAVYRCPSCKKDWSEGDRLRAVAGGEWKATQPNSNVIGFHANRLMSPFSTIKACVQDFADSYANYSLATFYNTVLGEVYDDLNECPSGDLDLLKGDFSIESIPDDVVYLTAGVDQQLDRLECTVLGVHRNGYYVLDHRSFYDINCEKYDSKAYTELLTFLKYPFVNVNGERVPMLSAFVDSSNGRATQTVYRFCQRWKNLHAIKGSSTVNAPMLPPKPTTKGGYELFMLGVNTTKNYIRELINRNLGDGKPHTTLVISNTVPDDYNEQLLSEELKRVGQATRWVRVSQSIRNEALDCLVYSISASKHVINNLSWEKLYQLKEKLQTQKLEEDKPETPKEEPRQRPRPQINKPRGNWVTSF